MCAIGLGSVAGIGRAFNIAAIKGRQGLNLLVLAALTAIIFADLSMLSKAETERIWLPFEVWLTAAPALLPAGSHRWWLGLNVAGALLLNHVILTNWSHPVDDELQQRRRPHDCQRNPETPLIVTVEHRCVIRL